MHEIASLSTYHFTIFRGTMSPDPLGWLGYSGLALFSSGLSFCPIPRNINWIEGRADFHEVSRRMHLLEYFHNYPPPPQKNNLSPFCTKCNWTPPLHRDPALDTFLEDVTLDMTSWNLNTLLRVNDMLTLACFHINGPGKQWHNKHVSVTLERHYILDGVDIMPSKQDGISCWLLVPREPWKRHWVQETLRQRQYSPGGYSIYPWGGDAARSLIPWPCLR